MLFKRLLVALFALIAASAFAAVDVNKATQAELESIKGIGPAISGKILEERKKGNFKDWTDMIDRVKGVGEGNAAKFSTEGLTVNGQGFKGAAAPAAKTADKAPAAADAKPAKAEKAAKAEKPAKTEKAAAAADDKKADKKSAKADKEEKADKKSSKKADKADAAASAPAKK